jgi:uncharacterized protein (DUF2249 family)
MGTKIVEDVFIFMQSEVFATDFDFDQFEALKTDESFVLVNDHDPKPLYYQFQAERTGQFTWEYLEQGPQAWRVRISRR